MVVRKAEWNGVSLGSVTQALMGCSRFTKFAVGIASVINVLSYAGCVMADPPSSGVGNFCDCDRYIHGG